jgi:hypothetical protein
VTRQVVFVPTLDDAPPTRVDTVVVVIDTAWTPGPGAEERPDVLSLRPLIAGIVERIDLFDDALEQLDRWADATGVIERTTFDGISMWHGIREPLWHWLHERMLWAYVIRDLERAHDAIEFRCDLDQAALLDVLDANGRATVGTMQERERPGEDVGAATGQTPKARPPAVALASLMGIARRARRRLVSSVRPKAEPAVSNVDPLDDRVLGAAAHGGRGVLVLSYTNVSQTVGPDGAGRVIDPHLGPVAERLGAKGLIPIVLGHGLDRNDPAALAAVMRDERLLPGWLLSTRWARGGPAPGAERSAAQAIDDQLASGPKPRLVVAGIDLGPRLLIEARRLAKASASAHVRLGDRVDRLITELQPAAILMTHEGIRTTWLVAAARRGIPTFAVQHGVIYATHPGYRHQRQPGLVRPSCTFVYGPFERRTLLEIGGYEPAEVAVLGSPRLDLDRSFRDEGGADGASAAAERLSVRAELGVKESDRLLVVSTVFDEFIRWSHVTHMLERLLGGPLSRVHVAFKLHPGETDEGPYRALLGGLAAAGGYEPPPISVIREIDLYRLLRGADAHLGMHSTVLTDAVVAGTQNLIATVDAHTDLLGYIPAGVARPVSSMRELLDALDHPWPPDPGARQAFLDEHFRSGDASGRVAEAIRQSLQPESGKRGG